MVQILFTPVKLKMFIRAYEKAKALGEKGVFTFEGNEYLVGYAKYLIQYLQGQYK